MKRIGTPSACPFSSWGIVDSMCTAYWLFLSSCLRWGGMVSTGLGPLGLCHQFPNALCSNHPFRLASKARTYNL